MSVFAVIAEYNPFHNGHEYQLKKIKESGEHTVVVIMSPNVVQRGDFAVFDKWTRAHSALLCGADLVLELPSPYALSGAEGFARGAIKILDALGCVDFLAFGSECGCINTLNAAAELADDKKVLERTKELLKEGVTFAKARALAVEEVNPDAKQALSYPNDILGAEYIRQLKKINSKIKPHPILRHKSGHLDAAPTENFASASFIRENLSKQSLKEFTPKAACELYLKELNDGKSSNGIKTLENALLLKLRLMSSEQLYELPDISEGLENRILRAAKVSSSIDELCERIKTKRYTMARIRRILMYALLSLSKELLKSSPQYIRILGHNQKGLLLLSQKTAKLPVVTSLSRAKEISPLAEKFAIFEENCTAAFELTQNTKNAQNEYTAQPIRL